VEEGDLKSCGIAAGTDLIACDADNGDDLAGHF